MHLVQMIFSSMWKNIVFATHAFFHSEECRVRLEALYAFGFLEHELEIERCTNASKDEIARMGQLLRVAVTSYLKCSKL